MFTKFYTRIHYYIFSCNPNLSSKFESGDSWPFCFLRGWLKTLVVYSHGSNPLTSNYWRCTFFTIVYWMYFLWKSEWALQIIIVFNGNFGIEHHLFLYFHCSFFEGLIRVNYWFDRSVLTVTVLSLLLWRQLFCTSWFFLHLNALSEMSVMYIILWSIIWCPLGCTHDLPRFTLTCVSK